MARGVTTQIHTNKLSFRYELEQVTFLLAGEEFCAQENSQRSIFYVDQLMREPEKIAAIILSKLKLNRTVFARNCEVRKVDKKTSRDFQEKYHLFGSTTSAFSSGLYFKEELMAVASFSKGRKMNRLNEDQRSFELIRFCCKSGITITGGLTKLIKHFCKEKQAGDIMTYVDKQLSDGSSFIKAGFKKHSETEPNYFLVNRRSFERIPATKDEKFDKEKFYLSKNEGNVKLVFTPVLDLVLDPLKGTK